MEAMKSRDEVFRERLGKLSDVSAHRRPSGRRTLPGLDGIGDANERDGVLVVERSVAELASVRVRDRLLRGLERARRTAPDGSGADDGPRRAIDVEKALFIDTETTGLGGSMVFLLGAMRVGRSDVALTQVFARDYTEEPALLGLWAEMLGSTELLVSFNGKSFDLPVLRDRFAYHGLALPDEPPHLDLLHASRRRWRDVLPDCRLQTLEWRVCGRRRAGDIPGDEIPDVYHRFVRTGEPEDILTVFHHNALDLITLGDLLVALAEQEAVEWPARGPGMRRGQAVDNPGMGPARDVDGS